MSVAERRGQRLRAAMEALAEHPGGLPLREVWGIVCLRVPPDPADLERTKSGRQRAEVDLAWHGVDLVKAGWLRREDRRWFITDEGRLARALAASFAGTALRPPLPLALDTLVQQFPGE